MKISRDDVAYARAANLIGVGIGEIKSVVAITKGKLSGCVRADEIVGEDIIGCRAAAQRNTRQSVSGNDIARTDRVAGCVENRDAIAAVTDREAAGGVHADEVALNKISLGAVTVQINSTLAVAGQNISRAAIGAAHDVTGGIAAVAVQNNSVFGVT